MQIKHSIVPVLVMFVLALASLACGLPSGPSAAPVIGSCGLPASLDGDEVVDLTIVNPTNATYEVVWVNYDGDDEVYGEVAPGETYEVGSFVTHSWCLREVGGGVDEQGVTLTETTTFTLAGNAPAGESGGSAISSCEGLVSIGDGATVGLTVENDTTVSFTAYWINIEGVEEEFQVIPPGEFYIVATGVEQSWCFRETGTGAYEQGLTMGAETMTYNLVTE